MTTAVAAPFRFFSLQVRRTRRLGPSLVRITFTGPDLHALRSHGRDQSLSLFLPHPGQSEPVVPLEHGDGWWHAWRELPDDVRAVMRSYTLRALRRDALGDTVEIDIDFVLHGIGPGATGPAGPASRWAARAAAGDRVLLLGPAVADNRAIRFRPPEDTGPVVLWGDETAVPAATAILESLPAGTRVRAWLEVPHRGDIQDVATLADAEITWLVRDTSLAPDAPMALGPLSETALPPSARPYVWLAGESGRVKRLRRHLVGERGIDKRRITFVGYWRHGLTEEQLRTQA
ncbi:MULTISPECIES: siderophore-interacting protein [Streptomyces]|uniref:Siderophore-interacting protein n=1 Tax=Streptomyces thermoviolaceus subsp. thermoviolaceus TaxID=66860 RepID=A0ABX0YYX5_STRTL|nr:siderophore-interacting protein [Streptomyces thermoviolaceus]MCM3265717.1 siderophore-interacting protein [Streptomyces thermoviolaceus]NJP17242.1 siderophore-interacting protein [Streptomyces thermoviolaceus subsp. thermoviolaceus]WTD49134.1 siderophore-interacting protein [Streptomyces thermoviolaceus]GGV73478.1 siderophore-interacting protein [Streptomyces thermoviolaceus subsp. apingens]GHB09347.1 siderophore-interacting protein [Streptomyces thermoviolaceus subsp. thermoviolaceus]